MKTLYAVFCLAILCASCKDNAKPTEVAPLLKADSSFVAGPEIPVRDSVVSMQASPQPKQTHTTTKKTTTKTKSENSSTAHESQGSNSGTQPVAEAPAKKGWSKTAKGAVIGGVVGAGSGAIINKRNRGAGAVIGGVLGAGAGAVIGNEMDKKDGRH